MEDIAVKVAEVDQRTKSNSHRIDKLEERQDNLDRLVSSVATLATEQEHIKDDVTEIKTDVKALTEKPGKWWDSPAADGCGIMMLYGNEGGNSTWKTWNCRRAKKRSQRMSGRR